MAISIPSGLSGGNIITPLEKIGPTERTGTVVRFKADPEIFKEGIDYDYDTLKTRLREQAFLNAGIHIRISDQRNPAEIKDETFCYEGESAAL